MHRVVTESLVIVAIVMTALSAAAQAAPAQWRLEGWSQTDFSRTSVDLSEIKSGGPPKDGIPSIDRPRFDSVRQPGDLGPLEPVITVAIGDDARAYPLRILIWHEIVNDTVGGVPVAVTYCPLCNSAVVFRREAGGKILDFGTTGKLRNSDLVMYDRQTESWWQQFTGEGIVGVMTGVKLTMIPVRVEAFERFAARYPQGKVLVPPKGAARPYGRNPYVGYDSRSAPYPFFTGDLPDGIDAMARVVVFEAGGDKHAVTLELLRKAGKVSVDEVTLEWQSGQNSALDSEAINKGRDVGNIVVRRVGPDGATDVVHDVTFAFVFNAFHPGRPIKQE